MSWLMGSFNALTYVFGKWLRMNHFEGNLNRMRLGISGIKPSYMPNDLNMAATIGLNLD
jgi:hypothetical protein